MQKKKKNVRGKSPFFEKCTVVNLIANCNIFFRTHGVYLQASSMQKQLTPHMKLATQHIMEGDIDMAEPFEALQNVFELNKDVNISIMVKKSSLEGKDFGYNSSDPSPIE